MQGRSAETSLGGHVIQFIDRKETKYYVREWSQKCCGVKFPTWFEYPMNFTECLFWVGNAMHGGTPMHGIQDSVVKRAQSVINFIELWFKNIPGWRRRRRSTRRQSYHTVSHIAKKRRRTKKQSNGLGESKDGFITTAHKNVGMNIPVEIIFGMDSYDDGFFFVSTR
eukprot:scaffold5141_cov169-Amphora_coffeaeformis.AAC.5